MPCRPARWLDRGGLSGISIVTIVVMAIIRMFPAITPSINSTTKTHSTMLVGSRNRSSGVSRYSASAAAYSISDTSADICIIVFLR